MYSTKEGYVFQNDINSKVLGFAFGLMAEIERNLISMRTKEALARRKQEGKRLGRKKGYTPKMRILAENKKELMKKRRKGTSCSELARQMGVSRTTMFRFCTIKISRLFPVGMDYNTDYTEHSRWIEKTADDCGIFYLCMYLCNLLWLTSFEALVCAGSSAQRTA